MTDNEQDLKNALGQSVPLSDGLDMVNAQIGISAGADFENNIWTFEMPNGFKAGAGKYMIVKVMSNVLYTPVKVHNINSNSAKTY
jgi:hypothetical protein